ncbi:putative histidine phosphotransferase HPT1p [Thelonectria olida]|uniref:Histidine phosphotransferase HPT1p n=1 Tax=Thelonectria olida TaxID=1576542 RepID=A0A9P8VWP5_9HYPO|nr:putative histidine phosphotransferase HPT1p [Thelonectria olida]
MSPAEDNAAEFGTEELSKVDGIDIGTFTQILEMDDDDEREFSSAIVFDFFTQAQETFDTMDDALRNGELRKLSDLGHFLKGSSATLGLTKVRDGCEKIQRYGKQENVDGSPQLDTELCLERIGEALKSVKKDFVVVEDALKKFYGH